LGGIFSFRRDCLYLAIIQNILNMANLTFSEKGVPMGRNKSKAANKNKQWSSAEDNYIRMAVEAGTPSSVVASKLGRSIAAVQGRKWNLGIEGRFGNSPRGTRKGTKAAVAPATAAPAAEAQATNGLRTMVLESGVPLPSRGNRNEEARGEMRKLFGQMKVGQSFVVPRKLVHVGVYLINKEFEGYKIKTSATAADKKFFRIFRVA